MSAISLASDAETLIVDATSISCTHARSDVWLMSVGHIKASLPWASIGCPQFMPPQYSPAMPLAQRIFIVISFCSVVSSQLRPHR